MRRSRPGLFEQAHGTVNGRVDRRCVALRPLQDIAALHDTSDGLHETVQRGGSGLEQGCGGHNIGIESHPSHSAATQAVALPYQAAFQPLDCRSRS